MTVSVVVNSREVPPKAIGFLLQRDPYPGGLRYVIEVRDEEDRQLPKPLRNLTEVKSFAEAQRIAGEVQWLLSREAYTSAGLDYFVNSVDSVSSDNFIIRISGICSRVTGGRN